MFTPIWSMDIFQTLLYFYYLVFLNVHLLQTREREYSSLEYFT
jgi:hypothetical protein